jgi:hypothetical protein
VQVKGATTWRFNRSSVADQAAIALREAIRNGALRDPLPGEHQLARDLRISRPSIRAALAQLGREGLVLIRKGHRTRIVDRRKSRTAAAQPTVCVVCPASREKPFLLQQPVVRETHTLFAGEGINWEEYLDPYLAGPHPGVRLGKLVKKRQNVCWLLLAASPAIQRWFAASGLPAVVMGSCPPDVCLPSVDLNYDAVAWHAAGTMARLGHRRLGIILPSPPRLAGDNASREGFLRYAARQPRSMTVTELEAPANPAQFRSRLDRYLRDSQRPTVVLCLRPEITVTLLTHALASGLRIPDDLSIVSRDSHPFLETALPDMARYTTTTTKQATRTVRIALSLLAGQRVPRRPNLIMPTFVPGGTLGRAG